MGSINDKTLLMPTFTSSLFALIQLFMHGYNNMTTADIAAIRSQTSIITLTIRISSVFIRNTSIVMQPNLDTIKYDYCAFCKINLPVVC